MRDPITDAAQDPSCLLCLTPDRGGSWWSRLRPAMPRDFAVEPMEWREFSAVAAAVGTDGFTLKITFNRPSKTAGYLFYGAHFFGFMLAATNILCRISADNYVFIEEAVVGDLSGRHTLKMTRRQGGVDYYLDGALVKTNATAWDVDLSLVFTAGRYLTTDLDGTVESIALMNDTTGEIVWQAAYSDLYDTSNPWPSPVPENFAENAKAFYDCQAVVREVLDPTHDYSFLIDFKLDEAKTSGNVFYAIPSDAPFALILQSNNQIDFFTNLLKPNGDSNSFASIYAYYQSDVKLQGRHQIECKIEANMLSSYLDGVLVAQKTSNLERTGTVAVGLPNCNSGYVYKIQITDLTDNQVVWSYPSEAERVRLITKTNVRTDRGAFEAADETQSARVDTALDLRGKVSSYTVVVDFEAAEFPETTTMECHQELAGQGGALIGSGTPPICSIGYYLASSGSARLQLSQEVAGGRHVVNATLTGRLSGRHICCGVVEVDPASPLTASTLYLDGVRIGNASIYAVPTGNAAVNATCFSIAGHSFTGGWASYTGKVYSGLLFDRALSAAEIAALTPKQA